MYVHIHTYIARVVRRNIGAWKLKWCGDDVKVSSRGIGIPGPVMDLATID